MRLLISVCLVLSILCGCGLRQPAPKPQLLSPAGVIVQDVPVGGLTPDEVKNKLNDLAAKTNRVPQNASFDETGQIADEVIGQFLDIPATLQTVMSANPNSQVQPIYQSLSPAVSKARLAAARKLGDYQTPIMDAHPDRVHNIVLTARLLHNTLLEPGQEFSFNRIVGEPTTERGFRQAVVLMHGEKSVGIGGGMCQASSTLYNAALEAGLQITERHPHSQPVSYVPEGRDATIFTNKDLRFINSTRQSLLLSVTTNGKMTRAVIWALPAG